jgi:hypothetical protein
MYAGQHTEPHHLQYLPLADTFVQSLPIGPAVGFSGSAALHDFYCVVIAFLLLHV